MIRDRHRRRSHDRARRPEAAAGRAPATSRSSPRRADGDEVMQQRARARFDVLLLDMSMPGQERHRADQAGASGKAEAAHTGAQHARGEPVRRARDQGGRSRLPHQGKRVDAARRGHPQGRRRAAPSSAREVAEQLALGAMPRQRRPAARGALGSRVPGVPHAGRRAERSPTSRAQLNLSVKTVSTHKARLMQKMNIDNQTELIRYAINHRLVGRSRKTPASWRDCRRNPPTPPTAGTDSRWGRQPARRVAARPPSTWRTAVRPTSAA